jgi:hypothetical protein
VKVPQTFGLLIFLLLLGGRVPASPAEIDASQQEKATRTAAQAKLDSQIVLALRRERGEAPFDRPTALQPSLTFEADGRLLVDIDATVSAELLQQIQRIGGKVINSFESAHAIRALVPLGEIEALAGRADVRFIAPAARAIDNRAGPG